MRSGSTSRGDFRVTYQIDERQRIVTVIVIDLPRNGYRSS